MGDLNFDSSTIEPRDNNYALIKKDWYPAIISDVDWRDTKDKSNDYQYLNTEFTITGDVSADRKIWIKLNLKRPYSNDPDKCAKRIAEQELKEICEAVGIEKLSDSTELKDSICMIKVGIKYNDYLGEDENVILQYKSMKEYKAEENEKVIDAASKVDDDIPF